MPSKFVNSAFVALALLVSPSLRAAETPAAAGQLGGDSPAAVVERLRASAKDEDFGELASCLAPAAREELAKGIWGGATMMIAMASSMGELGSNLGETLGDGSAASKEQTAKAKDEMAKKFDQWRQRYDETAKKHGLPTLAATEQLQGDPGELFAKADLVALIRDFGALLKGIGEEQGGKQPGKNIEGQLEDLKIDGDHATGILTGEPIQFVKIGGRWFIAELPQGPPQGEDEDADDDEN